jgi:hypothetical protein
MAKSQKHGNREMKKPKQVKVAAPLAGVSLIAKANVTAPGNKKRS